MTCDNLESIPLNRLDVAQRLGRIYRHERILRRLLKLLEDADRQGLSLTTADQLAMPRHRDSEGGQS